MKSDSFIVVYSKRTWRTYSRLAGKDTMVKLANAMMYNHQSLGKSLVFTDCRDSETRPSGVQFLCVFFCGSIAIKGRPLCPYAQFLLFYGWPFLLTNLSEYCKEKKKKKNKRIIDEKYGIEFNQLYNTHSNFMFLFFTGTALRETLR